MASYIRKDKRWRVTWAVIWAVMFGLTIVAYPARPGVVFGWLPSSVVTLFGLMVASFVLAWVFCRQRFNA